MFDEKSIVAGLVTFTPALPQRRRSIAIRQPSKAMRSAWLLQNGLPQIRCDHVSASRQGGER
jgi:hypothetical protein